MTGREWSAAQPGHGWRPSESTHECYDGPICGRSICMIAIVAFHILMLLLGLSIWSSIVPVQRVSDALGYLHNAIGITTPPVGKVRMIALIWIVSAIVIVDGCISLLVFITTMSSSG
jgi:hypothetical protein